MGLKPGVEKAAVDRSGVVQEKLRFDASDVGGVEQQFDKPVQKDSGDLGTLLRVTGECERIADDGLMTFVYAEGVSGDLSSIKSDEAGKDTRVEVLQKEFGGAVVVPA